MWKLLIAAVIVMNLGEAQRSSYAPRPGSNSRLLPRFRKNNTDTGLGTRGGEEDSDSVSSTLSPELQGTLEDHKFVHRVSQWPEDRQPFWFKNRYAISLMRDRDIDGGNVDRPDFGDERPRSSFQGPSRGRGRGRGRGRNNKNEQVPRNDAFFEEDFMDEPLLYLRRLHND